MNVELTATLDQIKSSLSRAKSIALRRLCDHFSNPVDISNFLLLRIDVVLQDIDETIKAEEDALEAYYQEVTVEPQEQNNGFNPIVSICADSISKAFNNCWVAVRASKRGSAGEGVVSTHRTLALSSGNDGGKPEYSISIQPDGYTANDVLLKLRSLGYAPTFKEAKQFETSTWADFSVNAFGIAFNLSSTVSTTDPPELDRFDEPATDGELPF